MRLTGPLLAGCALLGFAGIDSAHAEWRRAESRHFVVYGETSEASIRQTSVDLERYDGVLRLLTGLKDDTPAVKLNIFLLSGTSDLAAVQPAFRNSTVRGFYTAQPDLIAAFAINTSVENLNGIEVINHEYAHHFMLQNFPAAYPTWFVEGFAEYVATIKVSDTGFEFGKFNNGRALTLAETGWTSMKEILTQPLSKLRRGQVYDIYAQGWLTVHYFYSDNAKKDSLQQYLGALNDGAPNNEETLQKYTGFEFKKLDSALRDYMRRYLKYNKISGWKLPIADVKVQALGKGAGGILLLSQRVRMGMGDKPDKGLLARAQSAAKDRPNDPEAQLMAARAEIMLGDTAQGRALAQSFAATDADNAEAHYLIGLSYMQEGRAKPEEKAAKFKEARRHLARAFKCDPNHVGALYQTGLSLMATGTMTENTANIMLLAHQLAPQVDEISIEAASALAGIGKKDAAIAMLQPVASNPHGGKKSEQAQALIDGLRGVVPASDGTEAAPTNSPPAG